jgi:hypothetical protein
MVQCGWARITPFDVEQLQTVIVDRMTLVANDLLEIVSQLKGVPAREILFEIRRNCAGDGEGFSRPWRP